MPPRISTRLRMARSLVLGFVVLVAALASASPVAPGPGPAPTTTDSAPSLDGLIPQRRVALFDFEERAKGNYEDMPMRWYRIGQAPVSRDPNFLRLPVHRELTTREGFTHHGEVRFDRREHASGDTSLYLGLQADNVGAFLEDGAVAALPNCDYMIRASVRTTALHHAGARLVAYFIDDHGHRIDESMSTSSLIATEGRWQTIAVKLRGEFPDAAWIGIETQLVQRKEPSNGILGRHQIVYQEVKGGAWFDDIGVWQLPHVSLRVQDACGLVRAPNRPVLSASVRDLTSQSLSVNVTLTDDQGRQVARTQTAAGAGTPTEWDWTPPLERYGWYRATMTLHADGQSSSGASPARPAQSLITQTSCAFLWLPHEAMLRPADAERFIIEAADLDDQELELMPSLLDRAMIRSVVLSAWADDTDLVNLESRQERLARIIHDLAENSTRVSLCLAPVPRELIRTMDLDRGSALGLLTKPRQSWLAYLSPVLLRQGQRVHRWHLGFAERSDTFFMPNLATTLASATKELEALTPAPEVVLPWRLEHTHRRDVTTPTAYAIEVPQSVLPRHIEAHLEDFRADPSPEFWLYLATASPQYSGDRRVTDLTLRMIHAWQSGAVGLAISKPWSRTGGAGGAQSTATLQPDPMLGIFTIVAQRLAGRQMVGRLPLAEGVECLVFNGPAGGMIVAWNDAAASDLAVLDMFLGKKPIAIDPWGNRTPLETGAEGRHRVRLSSVPLFIEGINPELALFRAALTIEPRFIESTQTLHQVKIKLANPWPRTISGSMHFMPPPNWRVEPQRLNFSIAPGQSVSLPAQLAFPVAELAGRKTLSARLEFTADQSYRIDAAVELEIGLRGIDFDASLAVVPNREGGQSDALVTQLISNNGTEAVSLYAFAAMPGFPRQERPISRLEPGQQRLCRFRFVGAGDQARDAAVRVGLRESNGPAILNRVISSK